MSNSIHFDSKSLINGLEELSKRQIAPFMKLQDEATRLEDYAKQKAPWKDDTGQARRSLNASVSTINTGYRITLAHGVDYGIWLELAHEKRYAIVYPALKANGPEIIKSFENFMEKL
jgi:hypothetical protein